MHNPIITERPRSHDTHDLRPAYIDPTAKIALSHVLRATAHVPVSQRHRLSKPLVAPMEIPVPPASLAEGEALFERMRERVLELNGAIGTEKVSLSPDKQWITSAGTEKNRIEMHFRPLRLWLHEQRAAATADNPPERRRRVTDNQLRRMAAIFGTDTPACDVILAQLYLIADRRIGDDGASEEERVALIAARDYLRQRGHDPLWTMHNTTDEEGAGA